LKNYLYAASALAATVMASAPAHALKIEFFNPSNLSTQSAAYKGFRAAANFWEKMLTNDTTVYLQIGFDSNFSSPNIIASAGSTRFLGSGTNVSNIYATLAATGTSQLDQIAVANLSPLTNGAVSAITQQAKPNGQGVVHNTRAPDPTGTSTSAQTLNGIETASFREWDNDGSINNSQLWVNGAVLKALGFQLPDTAYSAANRDTNGRGIDARVRFNSAFNFDYDPTDGIGVGQTDFIGTAIHEFGHSLGFVSGVDIYDTNTNIQANLDTLQGLMSTLDLFRYSDDVNNLAPGSKPVLDWSVGNSAVVGDNLRGRAYFSFDGQTKGLSAYGGDAGYFSTGQLNGDGRQASHFMDTPYEAAPGDQGPGNPRCLRPIGGSRGIMDPTFAPCELGIVTGVDMAAFDAMGWNVRYDVLKRSGAFYTSADAFNGTLSVPEPATWALMIGGFGFVGAAMRRRTRTTAVKFA